MHADRKLNFSTLARRSRLEFVCGKLWRNSVKLFDVPPHYPDRKFTINIYIQLDIYHFFLINQNSADNQIFVRDVEEK